MSYKPFELTGKTAVVIGGTSGIGRAIAHGLAEAGADVVCHGNTRTPDATLEAISRIGKQAFAVAGDLAEKETPKALIESTIKKFGRIDVLVNNAGTIRRAPAADYSEEDWHTVIEVNLSAVFRLSQLAGRRMLEQGGGKIVNIASLLSFQGGITVLPSDLAGAAVFLASSASDYVSGHVLVVDGGWMGR